MNDAGRELDLAELKANVRGEVVTPSSPDYDEARTVWNATIDKRPLGILYATGEDDVKAGLRFARENEVIAAVRCGGHSVAGRSTCDDGLIIDLSPINAVSVDPEKRTVRVAGGCLLGDVDRAAQEHELVTPAGIVSHTGAGGLALGGGMGWTTRKYGLTCDNLLRARLITVEGEVVEASQSENADLYWALRGGGGNFGVVTEFEFRCHPLRREIPVGLVCKPLSEAPEFLRMYREYMPSQPNEMKTTVVVRRGLPWPGVPEELVGKEVITGLMVWIGEDEDAAREAFRPLVETGAGGSNFGWMSFIDLQSSADTIQLKGWGNYTKGGYLYEIPDGAIDALVEAGEAITSDESLIEIIPQLGAQLDLDEDDTAFTNRDAPYAYNVMARWDVRDEWQQHIDWARNSFASLQPFAGAGVYTNFFSVGDQDRVKEAFGAKYDRLVALKTTYDPGNVLALSEGSIPPAVSGAGAGAPPA